jgi:hypothetical protein
MESEKIKVEATAEQLSVLLQLLNIGVKAGAYDLASVEAVSFWAKLVESSAKTKEEADKDG